MAFRSSSKDRLPLRDSCAHPAVAIHTKQTTVHRTSAIFVFETLAATDYRGSAPSGQTAAAVHWRGLRAPDLIGGSTFVACLRDNGPRRSRLRDEVHLLFALQNSRHAPEIEETSMIHGIPALTRSLSRCSQVSTESRASIIWVHVPHSAFYVGNPRLRCVRERARVRSLRAET